MMMMMTTFKCRAPLYCIIIIREHQEQDQRRSWQRWSGFKRVEIIIIMLCQNAGEFRSSFLPPFTCYHQPTQSTYLTLVTNHHQQGHPGKGNVNASPPHFRGREPASQPVDYMQKDVISTTTSSSWKSIRMSSKLLIPFKLRFRRTWNFTAVNFYWSNLQVQAVKRVSLCALKKRFLKLDFFNFHNSLYLLSNLAGELRCWWGWRSMRISRSCLRVAGRSSFPFTQPRWRKKKKWKRETIIFK